MFWHVYNLHEIHDEGVQASPLLQSETQAYNYVPFTVTLHDSTSRLYEEEPTV